MDEYQDTNEVQNAIFRSISDEGRHLFQVGDVKQSIYRFRLADPTIFLGKYLSFEDRAQSKPGEPRRVVLSYNFRSRASVLEGVNFVFENIMSTAFGELDYTEDQRLYPKLPYPEQPEDLVELNVVDMAALEREPGEAKVSRDAAEAEYVARRVRWLLDSGFPVTQGDGFRMVEPEDIAILYRSPGTVMGHLTRALDRHRVPWTSDGSGDFFAETEVAVAVAFLEVVDNPRQDVPLLSVLTCPVYHFTGDDLAHLRAQCPQGDLYACLEAGMDRGHEKCVRFLAQLGQLRAKAVDLPGHKLLWYIYEHTGLLAVYGAMEGGQARQENLRLLQEYARRFEQNGHQGVFGLVTQLRRLRESGQGLPSPGRESGGGVRIMSIHKSKGLEFPVVLVAGLNRSFNRKDQRAPVLFHPKLGVGPSGLDEALQIEYPTLARRAVARAAGAGDEGGGDAAAVCGHDPGPGKADFDYHQCRLGQAVRQTGPGGRGHPGPGGPERFDDGGGVAAAAGAGPAGRRRPSGRRRRNLPAVAAGGSLGHQSGARGETRPGPAKGGTAGDQRPASDTGGAAAAGLALPL